MPFSSSRQRKYMFANEPKIARKWADEEKAGKGRKRKPAKKSARKSSR